MRKDVSKKQLKDFGILFGFAFPFFIGFLVPKITGHSSYSWTLFIGIIFLFLGLLKPNILYYPYLFWMKLGLILGWINSRIILSLIFIFVLLPISFIMKFFNYDPLKIKKRKVNSYKDQKSGSINLKRIF